MKPPTLAQVEIIDAIGTLMAELVCEHSPEAAIRASAIVHAFTVESFAQDPTEARQQLDDTREAVKRAMRERGQSAGMGDVAAELLLS